VVLMQILYISSRFPYPALKGDQVILYHRLKHLSMKHGITLLTFYQNDMELNGLEQIEQYCNKVETVRLSKAESLYNVLHLSAFSRRPMQTLYFRSEEFKRKLRDILHSDDYDIVHTYLLRMAEYTRHIGQPKVLELIDCMQLNLKKRLVHIRYPQRIMYGEEFRRIKSYENAVINEYDASVVVSDVDRGFLGSRNVVSIPLGIDTDRHQQRVPIPGNQTIVFSGNMAYYPNEIAILWFIHNCLEQIKRQVPGVQLKIVGIDPGGRVKKYHDGKTIIVTGYVESIIDELATAQIAIAPMQSGYGMHIKVLEAMSCGLPVVSTSSGLGTIEAISGTDVLIADDPVSFSNHCVRLLQNYEEVQNIGNAARKLVVERYGWKTHADKVENIYLNIVRRFRTAKQSGYDSGSNIPFYT
jgi:polysaccharide biosynthesis protein PslH